MVVGTSEEMFQAVSHETGEGERENGSGDTWSEDDCCLGHREW